MSELRTTLAARLRRALDAAVAGVNADGHYTKLAGGIAFPRTAAEIFAGLAVLQRMEESRDGDASEMSRALASLEMMQRDKGLWGEPTCNPASPADAGFTCHLLCEAMVHLRADGVTLPPTLTDRVLAILARAHAGMARGGHHTPNHRWIIAAALVRMERLLDVAPAPCVAAYRAEGLDCNAEGLWLERSAGGYDAVNDRMMQFLWREAGWAEAIDAANRNLDSFLALVQPDWSVETALSSRWDAGRRILPLHIVDCFLRSALWCQREDFAAFAEEILRRFAPEASLAEAVWVLSTVVQHDLPLTEAGYTLPALHRTFPESGFWRRREGDFSATAVVGARRILTAQFGAARVEAVRIQQAYMGDAGHFVTDEMEATASGVRLTSFGERAPRRPAYDLPLSEQVGGTWSHWHAAEQKRAQIELPPARSVVEIKVDGSGLQLAVETAGADGVAGALSFDLAPGGIWYAAGNVFPPQPGQEIVLTKGMAEMHYGQEVLALGPGRDAFVQFAMRDAESPGQCVRIIIPFMNPATFSCVLDFRSGYLAR